MTMTSKFDRLLAAASAGRGPDDCHPWPGNITVYGYGRYGQRGAHLLVFERAHGPIPEGHEPDHRCHTDDPFCPGGRACLHRRCVNLRHLEQVTSRENWERGRSPSRANAARDCCGTCGRLYDTVSHTRRDGDVRRCSVCTRRSNTRSRT